MLGLSNIATTKKSRFGPLDEDRAILQAAHMAQGIDRPMPVWFDNRIIAIVYGKQYSTEVWVTKIGKAWCGFTSYDDIINESTNNNKMLKVWWSKQHTTTPSANGGWCDCWPLAGDPVPGSYPGAARTAVQWDKSSTGSIYHGPDVSTDTKWISSYGIHSAVNDPNNFILYDRVLTYEACSISTSNQSMTNSLAAQRYASNGDLGLKICVTAQTATSATNSNMTVLQYTDQDGNATQSMPTQTNNITINAAAPTTQLGARVVLPTVSSGSITAGPFVALKAGDSGVQLIDNYTFSANNTGTLCFVLCQPLLVIPTTQEGIPSIIDNIFQAPSLQRVYDGACLNLLMLSVGGSAINMRGYVNFIWG